MIITEARPDVKVDEEIASLVQHEAEKCTILHCKFYTKELTGIRIWKTTFLIEDTGRKCRLIKPFNIPLMPEWKFPQVENGYILFTLVFEGLSRECASFYLREEIPQPGGFI